jgi:prepilin-type N-terminal cleavage/methylation domain-containing protein
MQPAPRRPRGFTLTEVLVVIAIISILMGLLIAGVVRARGRADLYAIQSRISQVDTALESFKTKHGFYPPDFVRITSANQFLPYLNRYAPNHAESAQALGHSPGVRRVDVWWEQVGKYLGPETAITFWLSGLSKNKQFPLTYVSNNGTPAVTTDDFVAALPPYNLPLLDNGTQTVERDVEVDFSSDSFIPVLEGTDPRSANAQGPPSLAGANQYPPWDAIAGYVCGLSQIDDGGKDPVVYFELASYRPTVDPFPSRTYQAGVWTGTVGPYLDPANGTVFEKDSFQLIAPGRDSLPCPASGTTTSAVIAMSAEERDNVTNFVKGLLESLLLTQ